MVRSKEEQAPIDVFDVAHSLHNSLIARYGLPNAVEIVREAHAQVEATLCDQQARHPEEWGLRPQEQKNFPPIPRVDP